MASNMYESMASGDRRTLVIAGLDPGVRLPELVRLCRRVGGVEQVVLEHDHAPDGRELGTARIVFDHDRAVWQQPS